MSNRAPKKRARTSRAGRSTGKRAATKRATRRRFLSHRGLLLTLILFAVLFSSVYPMRRYFAVRAAITTLEQQERTLDRTAADLAAQKQRLQTDDAVEQIAREQLGMVKVGEVPFAVVEPGAKSAPVRRPPVVSAARGPDENPSVWSRFWGVLKRATRSLR